MKDFSPATVAFTLLLFAGLFSCISPPDYPIEPVITFERLSKNTMSQGLNDQDFFLATISFTDGDGDLGNEDGEVTLFVRDLRDGTLNNSADKLPKVPEQGANNGISGEITFKVFQTCCIWPEGVFLPPCSPSNEYPVDTLLFEVYIKDRAGHESNHILLDPVYLLCD